MTPLFRTRNIFGEAVVVCRIDSARTPFNIEINETEYDEMAKRGAGADRGRRAAARAGRSADRPRPLQHHQQRRNARAGVAADVRGRCGKLPQRYGVRQQAKRLPERTYEDETI